MIAAPQGEFGSPIDIFVQYLSAAMTNLTIPVQKAEKASLIFGVLMAWR